MKALLSMYDKWVLAATKGQVSGVVLVGLSAAFDLVSPSLLLKKTQDLWLGTRHYHIGNFLSECLDRPHLQ